MKSVFREAVHLMDQGDPFVIATVVHTRGSTPQKPGAKLLVRQDGSGIGTLGGGCVEGDIWFAAKEMMRERSDPQYKDYLLNEDIAARDGLVCGGSMYFFIDPIWEAHQLLPFGREILAAYEGGAPVGLVTLVNSPGGRGKLGAKLLVHGDRSTHGSLGNPALERQVTAAALQLMPMGRNQYLTTDTGDQVFIEGYTAPPTLVLMGGGHVSLAIAPLAQHLGYRIFVMDDRPQFANRERFPMAEEVAVAPYDKGLDSFTISANTAIVIATRGHRFDDWALEAAVRSPAGYVGLIGSKRKTILIYQALLQRGIPLEQLKEVHAPVGLDIGARTPEEIAVSVIAQVVQFYMGGTGRPMKMEEERIDTLYRKLERKAQESLSAP